MLDDFTFQYPWILWGLLAIPVMGWYRFRHEATRFPAMTFPSRPSAAGMPSARLLALRFLPVLPLLSMAMLVVALARPQQTLREEVVKGEGIDILLVMDVSSSMLAQDFQPDRLSVSKRVAADFIDMRRHDRFGLVVFSGEAFTQCPLTADHRVLAAFVDGIQCGFLEDGTAIGMGLATAINRIKDSPAASKVVILLTDGVNNAGYVMPMTAAELARQFNVRVYTIGVGQEGEAMTPISRRKDGRYVFGLAKVEIDEDLLRDIAGMTGGQYFRATSAEGLQSVYAEIDQLEKSSVEITTVKRNREQFAAFAAWALLLLLLHRALRLTWLKIFH
ncbi:MAG: hypothetical protein RLY31_658 [Bacteroidota bacterium]|jgi:Ca-activated chloride channel family protein